MDITAESPRRSVWIILPFLFALASLHVSAQSGPVTLLHMDSPEGRAISRLMEVVLEQRMGMDVDLKVEDPRSAFAAVARGDADAFLEARLPALHRDYYERYRRRIIDCGCLYRGAQTGLVVPSYVDINRISELSSHAGDFRSEILGAESQALLLQITEETVLPRYGINYDIEASSESKMLLDLEVALNLKEWVVVAGWSPHWMFAKWDLKFLKQDLDKLIWQPDNIHIIGRRGLAGDNPELAQFLGRVSFTDDELNGLLLEVKDSIGAVNMAVNEWIGENEELVASWLP
ncbi:MAG: glycine betaine ABC transporter substrate-binding protein [Sediminispirochaetaceae bacterium]